MTQNARVLVLLAALALAAGAAPARAQQAGAAAGQTVYAQVCAGCHAETGEGNPGVYPPLAGSEWVNGPPARLLSILVHGLTGPVTVAGEEYVGLMPGWGQLKDSEIASVATYIRSAWGNFSPAVTVADVAAVREKNRGRTAPWTAPELLVATAAEK